MKKSCPLNTCRSLSGFTLAELIVVVAVLTVLSTIGFLNFQGHSQDARSSAKEMDLSMIGKAIVTESLKDRKVDSSRLKPITYANVPSDANVWIGNLYEGLLSDLGKVPVDPDTGRPYVVGFLLNGTGGSIVFGQVGGKTDVDLSTSMLRIEGNYDPSSFANHDPKRPRAVPGVYGLIPRWYVEDQAAFETTPYYLSGAKMYGGGVGNYYLYALNGAPVRQLPWYSNTGTLFYESYENVQASVQDIQQVSASYSGIARICYSTNAATNLAYEYNTYYVDGLPTVNCDIDKSAGNQSKSALHLKWVRDSAGGDGQYSYVYMDPTKKYRLAMDVKWTLSAAVNGGLLKAVFSCRRVNSDGSKTNIASATYFMPILSTAFTRIYAYVNAPDPSGNGLSISVAWPGPVSCILYRSNAPKSGDELWFDNHVVEEIP